MKELAKRWILLGCFAVVLTALAVLLPLLSSARTPKLSLSEPRVVVTPEPKTGEDAIVVRTPVPTPVRVVVTPRPVYPEKAVNLLVNGKPVFAVVSREIAEQLVRMYLEECAYENLDENAVLLTASVDAELSTVPADGSVEYLEFDAAMNKLRKNRSLIPVRRTAERVRIEDDLPAPQTERTPLLPQGTRMFRKLGVSSRLLVYTETLYKDGLAVSEAETLASPVRSGISRSVLIGTYRVPEGTAYDPESPDPNEGQRGPTPVSLSLQAPIKGRITGCFGLKSGEMHYGVDYAAAPGTRVVAPEAGTVIFSGERPGLGYVIEIRHDEGFVSRLCFARSVKTDLVLDKHVKKGDTVAVLPETEGAKESVLHYELLIGGIPYNPLYYLPA